MLQYLLHVQIVSSLNACSGEPLNARGGEHASHYNEIKHTQDDVLIAIYCMYIFACVGFTERQRKEVKASS